MDLFSAIHTCLTGHCLDDSSTPTSTQPSPHITTTDLKAPLLSPTPPIQPPESERQEQELATRILTLLITTEKSGTDLQIRLQDLVHTSGWYEGIAKRVLDGLVSALESGAAVGGALKEAFDKASAVATEFVDEHPVFTAVVVTVVAIGILVLLVPWAVEALGFGELGPIEGSFAALWQSTFPDAEAGSFFSYLQRLGMTWAKR